MDDPDWIKVWVYAVDHENGNALTEIGDFHRLETPDDSSWATASIDVDVDFSQTGDVAGQGIAFRFLLDRDAGGDAPRSEFALLDDFYLVASNGVPIVPPRIAEFSADDHYIAPGETATVIWDVANANRVTLLPGPGEVAASGSLRVDPDDTTEYTLTATNAFGQAFETIRVGVGPERPNIVFFLVDDMGTQDTSEPFHWDSEGQPIQWDLYRTPHMEALADKGMKFVNAYAMPVCSPTRVCWITGQNSARHHVTNWTDPNGPAETGQNSTGSHNSPADWSRAGLPESEVPFVLPRLLQDSGYRTVHCGKAHFGNQAHNREPLNLGFDINIGGSSIGRPQEYTGDYGLGSARHVPGLEEHHDTGTFLTEALTLKLNEVIGEAAADDVPFFAYMSHYAVHAPFNRDPRFESHYAGLGLTNGQVGFATLIEGMDQSLGNIVARLTELGIAEDTLIVFMGDNGTDSPYNAPNSSVPLRGRKGYSYEGGVRVPFIVAWAQPDTDGSSALQAELAIPGDRVEDSILSIFDLYPTFLSIAGVPFFHRVDGHDMTDYFRGIPGEHRPQELLIHFPHDHQPSLDYYTTLRQDRWKLMYHYPDDRFELYDLEADVGESTDLADADPDRVMAMARRMSWLLADAGAQWPTFQSGGADDPFAMPALAGVDLDGDGLDDNAEDPNRNGRVDPGETDPDREDSDRDSTGDGDEIRTGTDPLDSRSFFMATMTRGASGHLLLSWPSSPGANYRVEVANESLTAWSTLVNDVPAAATGARTTHDAGPWPGTPSRIFRVVLK